jgi:hypothetical protein
VQETQFFQVNNSTNIMTDSKMKVKQYLAVSCNS